MLDILERIVADPMLHLRWLNTISLMEHTGARKITSRLQAKRFTLQMLKHASEEARHALFFKGLIKKINAESSAFPTYENAELFCPRTTRRYLDWIEVQVCWLLKEKFSWQDARLREAAYVLITYTIEVRAQKIYPLYQTALDAHNIPLSLRLILNEETEHLREMKTELERLFGQDATEVAKTVCEMENQCFNRWINELINELRGGDHSCAMR